MMIFLLTILLSFDDQIPGHEYLQRIQEDHARLVATHSPQGLEEIVERTYENLDKMSHALYEGVAAQQIDTTSAAIMTYTGSFSLVEMLHAAKKPQEALVLIEKFLVLTKGTFYELYMLRERDDSGKMMNDLNLRIESLERIVNHEHLTTYPIDLQRSFHQSLRYLAECYRERGDMDLAIDSYARYFKQKQRLQVMISTYDKKNWDEFRQLANEQSVPLDAELVSYGEQLAGLAAKGSYTPANEGAKWKEMEANSQVILAGNFERLTQPRSH